MSDQDNQELKKIADFFQDSEFIKLHRGSQYLNTFALNPPNEMSHSRMIAWILNPREAHGLGDRAIKALLAEIASENEVIEYISKAYSDTIIELEYPIENARLDIILYSPTNDLVIVIENKSGSKEHGNQLDKYSDWIKKTFPEDVHVFQVVMDLDLASGSEQKSGWTYIDYYWLVELLTRETSHSSDGSRSQQIMIDYLSYIDVDNDYINDTFYKGMNDIALSLRIRHSCALDLLEIKYLKNFRSISDLAKEVEWSQEDWIHHHIHMYYASLELIFSQEAFEHTKNQLCKCLGNQFEGEFQPSHVAIAYKPWTRKYETDKADQWPVYFTLRVESSDEGNEKRHILSIAYQKEPAKPDTLDLLENKIKQVTGVNRKLRGKSGTFRIADWRHSTSDQDIEKIADFIKSKIALVSA